jgi:hypothetical protein
MTRITARFALAATAALLVAACSSPEQDDMGSASATQAGAPADDAVQYTVVVRSTWTKANHPFEYPAAGAVTGPHFSGVIGATHNAGYTLFAEGAIPTPGIERLSEEGKHAPLDDEIKAALAAGSAFQLFESGPLRDFGDSIITTFTADPAHAMVSLVAMIAPSPDWFLGVANLNLMENGSWVSSKTVQLNAYDSGGDDGATYKAADRDNNPKKPTMLATTRHFTINGAPVPVATLTLTRQ